MRAITMKEKAMNLKGGEKGWKAWFSGRKGNGKHNYIIISKITLNRAKENAKLKSLFFFSFGVLITIFFFKELKQHSWVGEINMESLL